MVSKIDFGASATKCNTQIGWSYENAPKIFGFELEGVFAGDKNQNMPKIGFKGDAKNSILGGWMMMMMISFTDAVKKGFWGFCNKLARK